MNNVYHLHDEVVVVGWSCRVPGADSISGLWSLLLEGRCAVTQVPEERFSLGRFGHPRRQERGKSYTWAAGVLDDVWGFDPAVFGISPREAEQMDPQQRILLQLTWEALEDAGIPRASLAGSEVGVFVGGSSTEYAATQYGDPAVADSHFATGNALAVLSNRISYVFNFRGPSITIDTACSSSLVALHHAIEAIRSGRVDTAIVGGINVIVNPYTFISFSQASMLSPTGLCRAFDAKADGFVRAEGGAVLVLRRAGLAQTSKNPIHGVILASDVNSDGRTNGISLPSAEAQETLLERVYSRARIEPSRLAFLEAHGTGTAVGDPIEANAIGRSLGSGRSDPLPIGSVKTNIGHLEPASGIIGVLKALLALNHGVLPPSLHFTEPNPRIDFQHLNLAVCQQSLLLPNVDDQCAGVNSFGFGGTNAHVIVAPGRKPSEAPSRAKPGAARFLAISAETKPALAALARKYSGRIANLSDDDSATIAGAVAYHRDRLSHRVVVSTVESDKVTSALDAYVAGAEHPHLSAGTAVGQELPTAFIYAGNGSQWVGMGIAAYRKNAAFRRHFDLIDAQFRKLAGWSLKDAMFSENLGARIGLASVAQPLIFVIESAATVALRESGLRPSIVLGHSVGEIAAAEAAGILDPHAAVKVIFSRSHHQELVRGKGRMAAIMLASDAVAALAREVPGIEVAAINSSRATTVAGPADALAAFKALAHGRGIAMLDLGLDYPFHTALMAPVEGRLTADLEDLVSSDASIPFVSTVTGSCLPGLRLGADYWWHNVRRPVRFSDAVREAAKFGARCFVEIGPRSTLLKHISDSLSDDGGDYVTFGVLDRKGEDCDPFDRAVATAIVSGARVDGPAVFGADPGGTVRLPSYPWQQRPFRFAATPEALNGVEGERHPFAGARHEADALEWHAHLDTTLMPELADHRVGKQILFPGTGFLEIALSVARQWLRAETVTITNLEILKPLDLSADETREVMTRVSPGSQGIEILSRPRLSQAGWILNCRGKMLHASADNAIAAPSLGATREIFSAQRLYELAASTGLHYGPAFRLAREVTVDEGQRIAVDLAPATTTPRFILDPMRLDACIHGMFAVLPEFRAQERGVAYIPVRLEEIALLVPNGVPQRAVIEILSKSERSILANCFVLDAHGEVIAVLRGARCQAVPVRRTPNLDSLAFVQTLQPVDGALLGSTGVRVGSDDVVAAAGVLELIADPSASPAEDSRLLEGWATTAAYEIAAALAQGRPVDPDDLIVNNRLPEELRAWLVNLLMSLETIGLARADGGGWSLIDDPSLPTSKSVVNSLAAECASAAPELLLAGEFSAFVARVSADRAIRVAPSSILTQAALDFHRMARANAVDACRVLNRIMQDTVFPADRSLRILQLGAGPLAQAIRDMPAGGGARLTIFEADRRRLDRATGTLPTGGDVVVVDAAASLESGAYDLIVAAEGLSRLNSSLALDELRRSLAPNGLLVAVEPKPSLFRDLVFGLDVGWFATGMPDFPTGPLRHAEEWQSAMQSAGFDNPVTATVRCGSDLATMIVGEAGAPAPDAVRPAETRHAALVQSGTGQREQALALSIQRSLASRGIEAKLVADPQAAPLFAQGVPEIVVQCLPANDDAVDPVETLSAQCLAIKSCVEQIGSTKSELWLVLSGAIARTGEKISPVACGAWAFSRTLANEFPNLTVRRVDVAPAVSSHAAAERLCDVLGAGGGETEFHIDAASAHVVRVAPVARLRQRLPGQPSEAAHLELQPAPGQRLSWQPNDRVAPGAAEVEIAVEATGVNFRDLMWMLSLLPDDILEDGFSGPTLGLECAGSVLRVGSAVKNLRSGDRVVAFAKSAFATHVTIPARHVMKLPSWLSCEAAATIPVAFLTAYYSLVNLAQLKRNEWVLIHGAAGGVGMAAIQIAQSCGARIIATAGSKAKRALLGMLGVEHVLDSRSTSFVDGVRAITGTGVDVVLNSLAGESMERSVACLRGFGRFVELGKRDYVANTHLGLRPFRKNLSYFGVDIDQLIMGRADLGRKAFSEVIRRFEKGTLTPLPYTAFDAAEISEAFHLMQQSAHIGKIVVRPPIAGTVRKSGHGFPVNAQGTHLITGAFGGFGMETAKWLVSRGVRHLALLGRHGPSSPEAREMLARFADRGVQVLCDPCDVADKTALAATFEKMRRTMPALAGVIHAAMVLDDAAITNLDAGRLSRVLEPKVRGADHLDALTRGTALDYFVMFSSVTTLIGNPGQANYVAANGYMEGIARRRRQAGLPALAIGWGPITDVGVIARSQKLRSGMEGVTAAWGMTAREALDLMDGAFAQDRGNVDLAVMTIVPGDAPFDAERLPLLRSPTFAGMARGRGGQADGAVERIDLRALAKTQEIAVVRRVVADAIVAQLARVLHFREEDISPVRPLGEIGLDSLMALELAMKLEGTFGINLSLAGASGNLTVAGLADEIIAKASLEVAPAADANIAPLLRIHNQKVVPEDIETLREIVGADRQKAKG